MGNQTGCSCPYNREDKEKQAYFEGPLNTKPSAPTILPLSLAYSQSPSNNQQFQQPIPNHINYTPTEHEGSTLRVSGVSGLSGSGCEDMMNWPQEIYLTVDEKWPITLSNNPSDPIEIKEVYTLRRLDGIPGENRILCQRVGLNRRKVQLLFKQHIPSLGKYFFEIDLLGYSPSNKCQFTVGIVDYRQASKGAHCRDKCIQQSFTYQEKTIDMSPSQNLSSIMVNKKIRVQVCREKLPYIVFYLDGQLIKMEQFSLQLDKKDWIMPFVQTQYLGISFQWKSIEGSSGWEQPYEHFRATLPKTLSIIQEASNTSNL